MLDCNDPVRIYSKNDLLRTSNLLMQTCVSTSSIQTTLSEAATKNLPRRGWNLSWIEPPYIDMNSA
jgi:hypothetical protein